MDNWENGEPVGVDEIDGPLCCEEAEMALIGCLLLDVSFLERLDMLREEHFYEPLHKRLFKIVHDLFKQNMSITRQAVIKELFTSLCLNNPQERKKIETHILNCLRASATAINPLGIAEMIIDLHIKRQILEMLRIGISDLYHEKISTRAQVLLDRIEKKLSDINMSIHGKNAIVSWKQGIGDAINRAAERCKGQGELVGVTTGLHDLNLKLNGFKKSDLIILAGRPGMGKTALALNMAVRAAEDLRKKEQTCLFLSLEMSAEQLYDRALSAETGISTSRLQAGAITQEHYDNMIRWFEGGDLPLFVDASACQTMASIRSEARKYSRKHNLGIVFIDYLQLIETLDKRANRTEVISQITRDLKQLAKELDVPIVALSQLSRNVENREDKRPLLSDLRESGSIEQDADIVLFVYREEYYAHRQKPQRGTEEYILWSDQKEKIDNQAEIIIAKHRNGPLDTVTLHFESSLTCFTDAH